MIFLLIIIATINGKQQIVENREFNSLKSCKIEAKEAVKRDTRVVYADCILKSEYRK
jgi:hypothetical protein